MSRKKIPVKIEDKTFNSLQDACLYLKLTSSHGLAKALRDGRSIYKGLSIQKVEQPVKPTHKNKRRGNIKSACPVICETLNKKFNTIKSAAKFAKVDGWTMSKKMETAGQFKDSLGNIYKRLKPMNTKNTYENTGDTVLKSWSKKRSVSTIINKPVVQESQKQDKLNIAKSVLKDKVIESINNNDYTLAKNLIDVIEEL